MALQACVHCVSVAVRPTPYGVGLVRNKPTGREAAVTGRHAEKMQPARDVR